MENDEQLEDQKKEGRVMTELPRHVAIEKILSENETLKRELLFAEKTIERYRQGESRDQQRLKTDCFELATHIQGKDTFNKAVPPSVDDVIENGIKIFNTLNNLENGTKNQ